MSADAFDSFRRTRVFGGLDGLRFLAIAVVVWHHSPARLSWWAPSHGGFLGVDLFFVISGFLIVTLLLRERERSGAIGLGRFYMRRTLRIFPLYYTVILGLAGYYAVSRAGSELGRTFVAELPIYLAYLGNFFPVSFGIVWSLAAEEQFYLLWPAVERNLRRFVIPLLLFAIAANQLFNFPVTRDVILGWIGRPDLAGLAIVQVTFTPILLGVGLAHVLHQRAGFERLAPLLASRNAPLLWLAALVAFTLVTPPDLPGWPRLAIQLLMTGLVASTVFREDHRLMPLLRWRPVAHIGVISYGIYLLHFHALTVAERGLQRVDIDGDFLVLALGAALAVAAAELSYRFLETPFLRLKRRFATAPASAR
jgi:peptidoglycan/LPS O-acetylase OafA/YrhL